MEEIKNFETFYALKVAPLLDKLSAEEKQSHHSTLQVAGAIILTVASLITTLNGLLGTGGTFITIALFAITLYTIYNASQSSDNYIADFKQSIISEVIHYLNPGLVYKPDELVPEREYRQSGLFRRRYDYYYGDDYIEGVYKNVSFHCSELRTTYLGGGRRNREVTIFKGLFFTAAINAKFTGGTYVWIKDEEQFGESIADERYRLLRFPNVYDMKMHDDIFDKYFFVCSTNPAEARSILNSDMMLRLLQFRKQIKRKVVISFVMGKCYVAIPIEEDLLEPEDLANKEEVKKYFFTVLLILSIVNQLQLSELT